jgi:NitT/TauT family transport system substrate-binding protein
MARKTTFLRTATIFALLCAATSLQAAEEMTTVDVVLDDVSANKVPFLIAADSGIYEKNGLNVRLHINADAVATARSRGIKISDANVDPGNIVSPIDITGGSWWLARVGQPAYIDRVIVSTTEDKLRDHVIAVSSLSSISDIKGKRLGYSSFGSVIHYGDLSLAKEMKWNPEKDIHLVADAANLNALKTGKADAILASALVTGSLTPDMGFKDLGDLTSHNIPLAGSGIMIERKWLTAHRDAAARFVKAAVQATALMKKDRKVFDASAKKWFSITDGKTLDHMYAATAEISDKPYPSVAGIRNAMAVYDTPAMRAHKAEYFYDSSFIQSLDKSGFLDHPLQ